jgi:membrane protein YdbS with pleckstrin-like domain
MIYERIKAPLLRLLQAPTRPPDPPAGTPESVRIFRAAPNFLKFQIVVWGSGFAGGLAAELAFVMFSHRQENGAVELTLGWTAFAITLLITIAKYFLIRLDYDMRYYIVTDRSLRIREGALLIHEATFTYANVQNLKIHQGPIERLLGISNLVVETAGGAGGKSESKRGPGAFPHMHGHQGVFRGIKNPAEVRDQILALLKGYRDAGLGDPEDRRRAMLTVPSAGYSSPAALTRLREIRDELRLLNQTAAD